MKLVFKPITLNDKERITSFTMPGEYRNCDFSFANMCSWRFLYDSEFAIMDGFLLIRFRIEEKKRLAYMMPIGKGNLKAVIDLLEEDALENGHPLLLLGITQDAQKELEKVSPGDFVYIPERDYSDYIYMREDLATLVGKKYQAKRNHVNKFKKSYTYKYMPITPELVPFCLELERKWYKANRTEEDVEELTDERRSLTYALHHFDELGLIGGGICVDEQIVAFSFGAPVNHNTFAVHIEKADVHYEGAYAAINQEFASHLPEKYIYINREEDLGIPGLRQAKLSYHPVEILEKSTTVKKIHRKEPNSDQKRANHGSLADML
ncbi:DUF2156 domain-containing protein [Parabacteroides sp. 52]|uniref:DUF2156 domain-containing protein n=1 Tax=unclassified Parabacteroides TaxID=2649774 RepID=UPI0013D5C69D|nr:MULTISPECIES: phosphatidylglycerol lysyltransferase domain-containing protein [unclassified Parabacteroides]MDH6533578.1 hypothetical protein [Parabacteroides sp. PM5-20]NDV54330.1 DUF2156 domain-containing protein [Parabacteroides sp. 52]